MKTVIKVTIFTMLVPISSFALNVSSVLDARQIAVGGNGCAQARTSLQDTGPNKAVLLVEANSAQPVTTIGRVACSLAVPVDLPQGARLVVKSLGLYSNVQLPKKAQGVLSAEVFTSGSVGQKLTKNVRGTTGLVAPSLIGRNLLTLSSQDTMMRVNTSATVRNQDVKIARAGIRALIIELEIK